MVTFTSALEREVAEIVRTSVGQKYTIVGETRDGRALFQCSSEGCDGTTLLINGRPGFCRDCREAYNAQPVERRESPREYALRWVSNARRGIDLPEIWGADRTELEEDFSEVDVALQSGAYTEAASLAQKICNRIGEIRLQVEGEMALAERDAELAEIQAALSGHYRPATRPQNHRDSVKRHADQQIRAQMRGADGGGKKR